MIDTRQWNKFSTWRNFADSRRMPSVSLVAIRTLHKDTRVGEALGKHLAADVVEPDALANVSSRLLHHRVAIDIWKQPKAEALGIARIRETVHRYTRLRGVKSLTDSSVQLVVTYRAPASQIFHVNIVYPCR